MENKDQIEAPVVIKKYANRRLYNMQTSSYITLEDIRVMVNSGTEFIVRDAKTGDDLTRSVLTQIIVEQEMKGANMLPVNFLKQIISYYDGQMKEYVPPYLDAMINSFSENQQQMQQYFSSAMEPYLPHNQASQLEEISKQNMQVFQKTISMFNPFASFAATSSEKSGDKNNPKDGA